MDRYEGFHEFVRARGPALSRTAFLLTGTHHLAEDLLQQALAKTAVHWPRVAKGGNPEGYVRRVMVNERTQVAEEMGCSVGTVKSQLHDALKRLRQVAPTMLAEGATR